MEYYDPIDRAPRRYAAVITLVVMTTIGSLLSLINIEVLRVEHHESPLQIEFVEIDDEVIESAKQESTPTEQRRDYAPAHIEKATTEQSVQTEGKAERTETINPNALFKPTTGNTQEQLAEGNRLAAEGEREINRGEGTGYNLQGTDQLDAGLQGRGLREGLPKPSKRYNTAGRVVVFVTIDSDGNVLTAKVDLDGTTTSDETLRRLAIEAATKAKFKPSQRTAQGGRITYDFKLQ